MYKVISFLSDFDSFQFVDLFCRLLCNMWSS